MRPLIIGAVLLLGSASALHAQSETDGRLFDQGRSMVDRSPRADSTLDHAKSLLGQWDISVTTFPTDSTTHSSVGEAQITYMNRGYAFQERRTIAGYDPAGRAAHVMSFLVFSPGLGQWALGEGSSYTEHIEIYNGAPTEQGLTLETAVRRRGGTMLIRERVSYAFSSDEFDVEVDRASGGGVWTPVERRSYARRTPSAAFMSVQDDYGIPADDLPDAARQFDFLIGTWDAAHRINQGGNWIQFPTTATATFVLDGHAILEHSWFDLDPNLPDASTSILRIFNRAERRWESLYLTNRGNTLLDFGGAWEDDRMVLHPFDTSLADPVSRWIFHDITPEYYAWFAETSQDRGETFAKTWTIEFTRRAER